MPCRVEGTAEAGVGWGMPGAARLTRAGISPPAEGAGGGRVGRAGSPIAQSRCGSCFTCGSRVAAIPPRAAMRSHASVNASWRATTVCHSAPHRREWGPPAAMDLPQTHASAPRPTSCLLRALQRGQLCGRRRQHGRLRAAGLPSAGPCHPACAPPTLPRRPTCRRGLSR